jgi:glycosyltransferase involved in cell wall biosynthesis
MGDRPLRIAVAIGKISYGGIENVVANYYRAIDRNRIQFDFYYGSDSLEEPNKDFIRMGARYFALPPTTHPFAFSRELRGYLRENGYTILHAHMNTLSFLAINAAWKEKVPVRICHNHSVPSGDTLPRRLLKSFLRKLCVIHATDFFACSEKSGRWFYGDDVFNQGRVNIMSNAIDFDRFRFSDERRRTVRDGLGISGKFVLGHVGRFTYAKNHLFLLEVFRKVLERRPDSELVLVGDGELRESIEKRIDELGIRDNVVLIGQTKNPEDYYCAFDVMALPSVFEGLPMMVVEGQASRRPIVVSEVTPDEAVFSNGVFRCTLEDDASVWADRVMEASGTEVVIDQRSNRFRIEMQAAELCDWYLNKADQLR